MSRLATILTIITIIMSSCDKDSDELTTRSVFTFNVDSQLTADNGKAWVIVRKSDDGELIDFKSVAPGQTMSFETDKVIPNDKIDVAYLRTQTNVINAETDLYYNAVIYTQVPVGSEWTMDLFPQTPTYPDKVGTYSLYIGGMPSFTTFYDGPIYSTVLSDRYSALGGYSYSGAGSMSGNELDIRSNANAQIVSLDSEGSLKYLLLENLKDKDHISKNFADFKSFDKVVTVNLPKALRPYITVTGYEEIPPPRSDYFFNTEGYVLYGNLLGSDRPRTSSTLGFINKFPFYTVSFAADGFSYLSVGTAPAAINYVDASVLTITNESMESFSFNTSQSVLYHQSIYSYGTPPGISEREFVTLTYYSGPGAVKYHQPIPDELIAQFSIPIDKVKFSGAEFYITGRTYSEFLDGVKTYNGTTNDPTAPFERASISVPASN